MRRFVTHDEFPGCKLMFTAYEIRSGGTVLPIPVMRGLTRDVEYKVFLAHTEYGEKAIASIYQSGVAAMYSSIDVAIEAIERRSQGHGKR